MGFLPEAVVNYLVRLGWSHGDQEIFTLEELVKFFDFQHVGATAGVFNPDKMVWVNHEWLRKLTPEQHAEKALPFFKAAGMDATLDAKLVKITALGQERTKTLVELPQWARYFYLPIELDPKAKAKFLVADAKPLLQAVRDAVAGMEPLEEKALEERFNAIAAEKGLGLGKIAQPVRVALTGGTASPGIYDVIILLGKATTLQRLDDAIKVCGA
jgi:glutamyl-tRNA synthetase